MDNKFIEQVLEISKSVSILKEQPLQVTNEQKKALDKLVAYYMVLAENKFPLSVELQHTLIGKLDVVWDESFTLRGEDV